MTRKSWDEPELGFVKELALDGLSAAQIVHKLRAAFPATKGDVTRSAIISAIHRYSLLSREMRDQRRLDVKLAARKASAAKGAKRKPTYFGAPTNATVSRAPVPPLPLPPEAPPKGKLVSFKALTPTGCRWYHGDPLEKGSGFCGCPANPGMPYCEDHALRAYPLYRAKRLAMETANDDAVVEDVENVELV